MQLQQVCWLDGELLQDWGTVTLTIKIYFKFYYIRFRLVFDLKRNLFSNKD
jgi:hypothetical protein